MMLAARNFLEVLLDEKIECLVSSLKGTFLNLKGYSLPEILLEHTAKTTSLLSTEAGH